VRGGIMTAGLFTSLFVLALAISLALRLWLAQRQVQHVQAHRAAVPAHFADRIGLAAHQKAADYTAARTRLAVVDLLLDTVVLLALTLGGGLALIAAWIGTLPVAPLARDVTLIVTIALVAGALALPLAWYRTFVIEQRFGFNRMTPSIWIVDLIKSVLIGAALGIPLVSLVLWLMARAGALWWLYAWLVWVGFQILMLALYPTVIAPLFNTFKPLADGGVKDRVEQLLARCGFRARGLYVMDGSKRSAHGNAYFTGFGRARRIVFFDTLLARLAPDEIEAVLAHELGHFRLRHVRKRLLVSMLTTLLGLALLGWLAARSGFYHALGVPQPSSHAALLLFMLAVPAFTFFVTPLAALWSRRHEFEADAFATEHASATELAAALVKLHKDNASTLTPDPVYVAFYYSHPPPLARITRLHAALAPAP
jgi:STE24 endopeptidase